MNEKRELMSFSVIEQVLVMFFDAAKQSHGLEEPCQYNLDDLQGVPLVFPGFLKVGEISTNTRRIDIADSQYLCLFQPKRKEAEMSV